MRWKCPWANLITHPQAWESQPFSLDFVGERAKKLVQIKTVDCIS